jgi:hypothetical protein
VTTLRAKLFAPLERAVRRRALAMLQQERPTGMEPDETLIDYDEERRPSRLLWVASGRALYVLDGFAKDNWGFRVRAAVASGQVVFDFSLLRGVVN